MDKTTSLHGDRDAFVSVHQVGPTEKIGTQTRQGNHFLFFSRSPKKGLRKTFTEFNSDCDRLAAGLLELGLSRGDRVGIWGPNSYEWVVTMVAAAKAGMVLVNINPAYQPSELRYCINKVGVRAIVSAESFKSQNYYSMLSEIAPEIPSATPGDVMFFFFCAV